jgi:hypothetical protein
VAARKRKQELLYGDALREKVAAPVLSLASIAERCQALVPGTHMDGHAAHGRRAVGRTRIRGRDSRTQTWLS